MYRTTCVLALLVMVAMAGGCTMCAHPFDYCGPMFTGGCGEQCIPNARAGSICSQSTGCTSCGNSVAATDAGTVTEGETVIVATTDSVVR